MKESEKVDDHYEDTAGCPYVNIGLEKHKVKILADISAEITVLSDKTLKEIGKGQEDIPTLSVVEFTVHGVVPKYATEIQKQVMIQMTMACTTEDITFLVINGLNVLGILHTGN